MADLLFLDALVQTIDTEVRESMCDYQEQGYNHPAYVKSLEEFGTPQELPRSGGWLLTRRIPNTDYRDAMGPYPIFSCRDWGWLSSDIQALREEGELVSLVLVTDPFGSYTVSELGGTSPEVLRPFKTHYTVDLKESPHAFVSKHHQRYARKASRDLVVDKCEAPSQYLSEWCRLYSVLCQRHGITGIQAFSRSSFEQQFRIPGFVMLRATHEGQAVGVSLWYLCGDTAYYHLGASSELGYTMRASFALFWFALDHLASRGMRRLNLGSGAGLQDDKRDGLSRFKSGWSTGTSTNYVYGKILDETAYDRLAKSNPSGDFFPRYRGAE